MDKRLTHTILIVSTALVVLFALGGIAAWYATKSALVTLLCMAWFIAGALSYAFALALYTLRESEPEEVDEIEIAEEVTRHRTPSKKQKGEKE